jgi:hypothetical protein
MNDHEPTIDENSIERALARVERLAPSPSCPCCGRTKWNGSGAVDGLMMVGVETETGQPEDTSDPLAGQTLQRISGVAFACANCGFLRFHVTPSADLSSSAEPGV